MTHAIITYIDLWENVMQVVPDINFRYTCNKLNKPTEIYNYLLDHILLKQQAGRGIYKIEGNS